MMNIRELLFRVKRRAALAGMRARIRYGMQLPFQSLRDSQNYLFCRGSKSQLPSLPWQFELTDLHQVESTLAMQDTSSVLASGPHDACIDTQTEWTRSRLQKLVTLGLVCQQGKDKKTRQAAADAMVLSLGEWLDANPWLCGVNYQSTMECALRLISCCHAFDMARQYLHRSDDWQDLLYLVHSHAYFIERRLCLYSFSGNHTIGECAGLVYAGVIFPEIPGAQRWLSTGLKHMSAEVNKQILTDGGNCEKSFQYLLLLTDLCGLVTLLLEHYNKISNNEIKKAWRRGRAFLQEYSDCPQGLPAIGDSDDAYALSEYLRLSWQDSDFSPSLANGRIKQYPASGLSRIEGDQALHGDMLFSHGHLGTAKFFGHGHADALSVSWKVANDTLLIDPGTYLYESEPRYRNYFRGTSAHNTVLVDGRDQAQQHESLTFHWLTSYFASMIWSSSDCNGKTIVLAYHNGYADIGVIHWRAVIYDSQGVWWVCDRLVSDESHNYQLHWHVDAALSMCQNIGVIDKKGQCWTIRIDGSEDVSIHHGDNQLPLGWVSRHYGEKEPLQTLRAQAPAKGSHEFITTLITPECSLQSTSLDEVLLEQIRQHCILPITLEK